MNFYYYSLALCLGLLSQAHSIDADCGLSLLAPKPLQIGKTLTRTLFGVEIPVRYIPSDELDSHSRISGSRVLDPNSIFIGVLPYGHTYVVAGGMRLDGNNPFDDFKVTESDDLSHGLGVQLSDEDGTLRRQVEEYIATHGGAVAVNCVSTACKVVDRSSGLSVGGKKLKAVLPNSLLKRLLTVPVRDAQNRPIKVQAISIGYSEPGRTIHAIRASTADIIGQIATLASFTVVPTTAITAIIVWERYLK